MIGGDQIGDHRLRLGLGSGREIFSGVDLPDCIAEVVVDQIDGALRAGTLLLDTAENFAEEVEILIRKCVGQERRIVFDEVEGEPVFPGFKGSGSDERGLAGEGGGCPHHELLLIGETRGFEVCVPIDARSFCGKVAALPKIVGLGDVFDVRQADVGFGDGVLEGDDASGARIGVVETGEPEHGSNVSGVFRANLPACGRCRRGSSRGWASQGRPAADRACSDRSR